MFVLEATVNVQGKMLKQNDVVSAVKKPPGKVASLTFN